MKSKNSIGKWTLAALLGYEFTLLAISLTPAAGKGTSFGNPGMWQNMILIAAFYLIPLVFCKRFITNRIVKLQLL